MPAFVPIFQAYVDSVKSQSEMKLQQQELTLNKLKTAQDMMNIQQQMQERQVLSQAWSAATDPNAQPQTNPATGRPNQDPAEHTASVYDSIAQKLGPVNPKLALEYSTKASTLRDQAFTRQKDQIAVQKAQTEAVGNIFGSATDQESYTDALAKLPPGVSLQQFGLTGNYAVDQGKLKTIAQSTLSYKDKLNAQHQSVTEDQASLTYQEKVRHDMKDESLSGAKIGLEGARLSLDKSFKSQELDFRARADARAAAGFARTSDMDLAKTKDFAGKVGPQDKLYAQGVIDADPTLKDLNPDQKKAAVAELVITARGQMARNVKKPGDAPTADDFVKAVDDAKTLMAKRTTPARAGFLGIGQKDATRAPLPPVVDSKDAFAGLDVGAQFRKGNKIYKKTSATDVEEIK